MSPSSLVFVAVIAIWATYAVLHVSRRREQLAMLRAVNRFSSRMRVLERRAAASTSPAQAGPVSSAHLARPQPLRARPDAPRTPTEHPKPGAAAAPRVADGTVGSRGSVAAASGSTAVPKRSQPPAASARRSVRVWPPLAILGRLTALSGHQVRALALAVVALGGVTSAALAATGVLPGAVPVAMTLLLGITLALLRARAVAARAARRRRLVARRRAKRRLRKAGEAVALAGPDACPPAWVSSVPEMRPAGSAPLARQVSALARRAPAFARDVPFDITAFDPPPLPPPPGSARPRVVATDSFVAEPGWEPTPVPPPTYTLKARAGCPAPARPDVPVPIELDADDVAWDVDLQQPRVVNG